MTTTAPGLPPAIRRRLELPRFTAAQFTPTKFVTADAKVKFAQDFVRFLAHDMPEHLFTQVFYQRLSNTFGHIAHFNRHGFVDHYFRTPAGKRHFLMDTMNWRPVGDPAWTFVDVEIALQRRIHASGLLEVHAITCRPLRPLTIEKSQSPVAAGFPAPPAPAVPAPQGDLFAQP